MRRGRLPKNDKVMLAQVRRYVRRYGGTSEEAYDIIKLARHSGPKAPEKKLADALFEDGMNSAVVKAALGGMWSDFKSPLMHPKKDLVDLLREGGRIPLAERVEKGEFDG